MAAPNFHRKIIELPANTTEICTLRCDPLKKSALNCTANCNTTAVSSPPWPSLPLPLPPPSDDGDDFFTTPPKHHHSSLSLPLKISLVILVLTFSFFLLYTLYKFYTVWYRRRRTPPAPPSPENQETRDEFLDHDVLDHPIWYIRTIGLQPSVISAITVVKYSKSDGLIEGSYCSVCLSDFQEDETLRLLPKCNHAFHISCIDTWLRSHTNCPLCRAGIVKNRSISHISSSSGQNLDDLGQIEEPQISIPVTEEANREQRETEDENQNSSDLTIDGIGSGSCDLMIMRRSVSLNDYAACRVRSDVRNNNNYYSDRHEVQIRSVDGDLGDFQMVKVDRTAIN